MQRSIAVPRRVLPWRVARLPAVVRAAIRLSLRARWTGLVLLPLALGTVVAGCGGGPRVAPVQPPTLSDKLAWILRLEDQRLLRDPAPPVDAAAEPAAAAAAPPRPVRPDLVELLADPSPRVRRRAALAIGRVGRPEGIAPLVASLGDAEAEVRQMSAFALGLLGDESAAEPLLLALDDPSPLVQGRAAEALGRIGAAGAAEAIGGLVEGYVATAFELDPEDLSHPLAPEVEAFRLGLYALADLRAFEPLAAAVLQPDGQPILWWWPVAYALARVDDPRAIDALATLAGVQGRVGVALAAEGLGALGSPAAVEPLGGLLDPRRRGTQVLGSALRALGRYRNGPATEALRRFAVTRGLDPVLRRDALDTLRGRPVVVDVAVELLTDGWPPLRAAALRALAAADAELFLLVLSGLGPDPDWRVRAALADALVHAEPSVALPRLEQMLADADQRVLPSVLGALVELDAPDVGAILADHLASDDVVVRKTAARLLGEVGPPGAAEQLRSAYLAERDDPPYLARAAIIDALAELGGPVAREVLTEGLADRDWAVRVRAARWLERMAPGEDHDARIRPAPGRGTDYAAPHLVEPPVSPHVYIETERGTIQIELAVLDAPLTADNFVRLARRGFYDGLTFHRVVTNYVVQGGDPRGDSEGGPGYTLRDEINQLPFLRGTVGMALDWQDTGGSQFFITRSPQPQLDGRYTAFGRVIEGLDVVDALRPGDSIERVRVWDGTAPQQ